jgi:hypothetical protein
VAISIEALEWIVRCNDTSHAELWSGTSLISRVSQDGLIKTMPGLNPGNE